MDSSKVPQRGEYSISTGSARIEPDSEYANAWLLFINGVPSSHLNLEEPRQLEFEYMQWFAAIIEDRWRPEEKIRALHLGGGACTMACYLVAEYPNSRNTVVEIDAELARYVREWFDLPRAPRLKIRVGEAREVTESLYPGSRDLVIRDVFSGRETPETLLGADFVHHVKQVLSPGGIYLVNCGGSPDLVGARREAATLAAAFQHLAIIADPPMLKGRRYGNIVFAASDQPLATGAEVQRRVLGGALPAKVLREEEAQKFALANTKEFL